MTARLPLHAAIQDALADARERYDEKGILLVTHLHATNPLDVDEATLTQAVYTLFRGLHVRLPPGAALYVWTRDRAGGDVELVWESREDPGVVRAELPDPAERLREGPYGDLYELALLGLDAICRVRTAVTERQEDVPPPSASSIAEKAMGKTKRRFTFLLPGSTAAGRARSS